MTKGLFKKNINRSIGGNLLVFLIVLLLACFMLLPIVYAVSSAFKPLDEIFIFPPRMFVRKPTLDNFVQLAQITSSSWVPLSRYIFNSLFVSAVGTVGHMLMASMAAYPLAKHRFIGQRTISGVVKLSLLFTSAVTAIPQYIVMSSIGIVNTYWALIFPAFQAALGLYLMQSFMGQIPEGDAGGRPDRRGGRTADFLADCDAERQARLADRDYFLLPAGVEQRRFQCDL